MLYSTIKKLKKLGVLGINERNFSYVLQYNDKKYMALADDKIQTKQLAQQAKVAVPKLYGIIEYQAEIHKLQNAISGISSFVVKPAHGSGGDGILIIEETVKNKFRKTNGKLLSIEDLEHHIADILSGIYSLGAHPDVAFIEHRVITDDTFVDICYQGVPDIRVVVFLGFPIMAMARLPTILSDGKANLHQGAIGVGIDIATGKTFCGVMGNSFVYEHPDTLNTIIDIQIPHWDNILNIAATCYELTNLGFIGVDTVLDNEKGPLVLEINARPGLNIQIANGDGLARRLQIITTNKPTLNTAAERVAYAKSQFQHI